MALGYGKTCIVWIPNQLLFKKAKELVCPEQADPSWYFLFQF